MRKEYELACKWKVYVDNYLKGYHIPIVHPSLHKEIDFDSYGVEPMRYSSIQHAPLRPVVGGATDRKYDRVRPDIPEAVYGWVFPNIMSTLHGADADERRTCRWRTTDDCRVRVVRQQPAGRIPHDPIGRA